MTLKKPKISCLLDQLDANGFKERYYENNGTQMGELSQVASSSRGGLADQNLKYLKFIEKDQKYHIQTLAFELPFSWLIQRMSRVIKRQHPNVGLSIRRSEDVLRLIASIDTDNQEIEQLIAEPNLARRPFSSDCLAGVKIKYYNAGSRVHFFTTQPFYIRHEAKWIINKALYFLALSQRIEKRYLDAIQRDNETSSLEWAFGISDFIALIERTRFKFLSDDVFIFPHKENYSLSIQPNKNGWELTLDCESLNFSENRHKIPLVTLESREFKTDFAECDYQLMQDGFYYETIEPRLLESKIGSLKQTLAQRQVKFSTLQTLAQLTQNDQNSQLIHWSVVTELVEIAEEKEHYLKAFQAFSALVIDEYGEHPFLKKAIAYGLTYGWEQINYEKAISAIRILTDCGENPEVIHWITDRLCKRHGRTEDRITNLQKWLKCVQNKFVQKYILEQILSETKKRDSYARTAKQTALKLLTIEPSHPQALDYIIHTFEQYGQIEEAIQYLSDAIKHLDQLQRPREAAKFAQILANLWEKTGNTKLATHRLGEALKRDPEFIDAWNALERLSLKTGDEEQIASFYKKRWRSAIQKGDIDLIYATRRKLLELSHATKLGTVFLELECHLVPLKHYDLNYIPELKPVKAKKKLWLNYIGLINERIQPEGWKVLNEEQLSTLLWIVRNHVQDIHLEADLVACLILFGFTAVDLERVERSYLARNNINELMDLYQQCLEASHDDEVKVQIMSKMLASPSMISSSHRETIALALMKIDDSNDIQVKRRISQLVEEESWDKVIKLTGEGLKCIRHRNRKIKWLKQILAIVASSQNQERIHCELELYEILLDTEDDVSIAQQIIHKFAGKTEASALIKALKYLLDARITPAIPDVDIKKVLSDLPEQLATYYELKALAAQEPKVRSKYFHSAYLTYKNIPNASFKQIYCLEQCLREGLYLELITHYRQLTLQNGEQLTYVSTLLDALKHDRDNKIQASNIIDAIKVAQDENTDATIIMELCELYMRRFDNEKSVVSIYLGTLKNAGDTVKEARKLIDLLSSQENREHVDEIDSIHRLKEIGEDDFLRTYLQSRFEQELETSQKAALISIALDLDALSATGKSESFEFAINTNNRELIAKSWRSMVTELSGVSAAREFFEQSKSAITAMGMESLWLDLMANLLTSIDLSLMDQSASHEILILAGNELLDADEFLNESEEIFGQIFSKNRNESRVWLPYYFVLRKNENKRSLTDLLEYIIPRVSRDLSILKSYPVTVESLENELLILSNGSLGKVAGEYETLQIETGPADVSNEYPDWRAIVRDKKIHKGMFSALNQQAFASVLEKHIALQVIALLSGEFQFLKQIRSRVWRDCDAYDYPLSGRERYPSGYSQAPLGSPLHRLMNLCTPALAHCHKSKFSIRHIAHKLKCQPKEIMNMRNPMRWDSAFLNDFGFKHYQEKLNRQRYVIFDLEGLKDEIFFDGSQRSFYFDANHYKCKPISQLFHRIIFMSWQLKFNYFIPLHLDVRSETIPFLDELKKQSTRSILSVMKDKLFKHSSKLALAVQNLDLDAAGQYLLEIGELNIGHIYELRSAMTDHVARLQLSETLDLVGIIEALTGLDLERHDEMKLYEIFDIHDAIENLIHFACNLKI